MSGFVSRAACHGRRPTPFSNHVVYERAALSTQMLKDRGVARFIVAPDGFGKTFLALEYAETMFAWAHTFWINAKSPCFIRDLDDGDMAQACLSSDKEPALVVFDDVPELDPLRMEAFSRVVDKLLEAECEVVITCVPTCDISDSLQRDRILIGARELLLDDAELDLKRTTDEQVRHPASQVGPAGRVAALAWATDDTAGYTFAKSAFGEDMPSDRLLALSTAFVLQSGACSEVVAAGLCDKLVLSELVEDYPHLGFDEELDRFQAPALSVDALATPLKGRLPDLVARSSFETPEELVHAWADILVGVGLGTRACDIVRTLCPRRKRATWLLRHVRELAGQACFLPMLRLASDRDSCKGRERMRISAVEALCRMLLGDEEAAFTCAKRYALDAAAPIETRVVSLLVLTRLGAGALASRVKESFEAIASEESRKAPESGIDFVMLAQVWCARERGLSDLAAFWSELHDADAGETELCLCASLLFGLIDKDNQSLAASSEVRACERYIRALLKASDGPELDYFVASAGLSFEEARDRGVRFADGPLDTASLIELRRVEMDVLAQRRTFDEQGRAARARRNASAPRSSTLARRPDEGTIVAPRLNIPVLDVRLFGHFEVSIGGVPIDANRFSRRNAQTLLAVLVLNQGREQSRELIERAMWPQSTEEVAHKNFYTVWSSLRNTLALPDGTCPYLVRHQYGCRIEPRYVHSDIERLTEICRELLFGVPNVDKWANLFVEIDRDFTSELLPAERKNRLVLQARNEYKTRLVDALVSATISVIDIGNPQWGVWFARAAIRLDETREDAYVALMRAQVAGNQRTAAMMTFLKCRRVLADQLGIDPSPEITMLYESLLDVE